MTMQTMKRAIKGSDHDITVSTSSARTTVKFTEPEIGIYCATACYVKFGDDTVTVSTSDYDVYVPAGQRYDLRNGGAGYAAVILASGSDTAYINEWTDKQV